MFFSNRTSSNSIVLLLLLANNYTLLARCKYLYICIIAVLIRPRAGVEPSESNSIGTRVVLVRVNE